MGYEVNGTFPESYIDFISEAITKVHGSNWNGLKMVEIGDEDSTYDSSHFTSKGTVNTIIQPIGADGNPLMRRLINPYIGKNFEVSEEFADMANTYDVLTNIGTVEHFNNQYEAWQIMHEITKVGGVMIHIMPDAYECEMYLRWYGHCHNYFDVVFFENLCDKLGYEIVSNELLNFNRSVALKKVTNSTFNINKEEFLNTIKLF
jgi:hypothetical protein